MSEVQKRIKRRGWILTGMAFGMLAFAFINIPLFRVYCSDLGLSVPADQKVVSSNAAPDPGRRVDISFTGVAAAGLFVTLNPKDPLQTVAIGQRTENQYTFVNKTDKTVRFRAIHDIYPGAAAEHMALIQCFCFSDHTLAPHETLTLPVIYRITPGLSQDVQRASVIYTLEPLAPAN